MNELKRFNKSKLLPHYLGAMLSGFSGLVNAGTDGIVSSGIDSTSSVVFNIQSGGSGGNTPGIFAVVVGTKYSGYSGNILDIDLSNPLSESNQRFLFGQVPGTLAQFQVNTDSVYMNRNTFIANQSTLGVSGATTLQSSLDTHGVIRNSSTSNNGFVTFADSIKTMNTFVNLKVDEINKLASLTTTSSGHGLTVTGTTSTVLKGGTNSGILTLQDGDTVASGSTPAGTSITISGSGVGTAATVFQTTTNTDTTSVTTAIGTSEVYDDGSTAILQAGPTNAVTVTSGNAGSTPGVSINGVVGTGSTSTTGVLITGSGQNGQAYSDDDRAAGVTPTWADVAIQSSNYGRGDPTLGSAILITDYGIQMLSPQPIAGQQIVNNTNINNSTGSMVNNNGMNTNSGSVTNNMGGNSGSGSATNNIGMNTSTNGGTATNNIGGISGNGTVNNGFGNASSTSSGTANNTIGQNDGTGVVNNTFGGGSGVTNNVIGNNNPQSSTQINGGSTRMTVDNNGVNFSNASTGGPVRLSGVADGSSPFDAANIRQVFGAVATSMATAPTVDLAPGESGIGVGTGYYGGYSAIGINYSHLSRDGAQVSFAVAKGMQSGSRTAIRAGLGWKW